VKNSIKGAHKMEKEISFIKSMTKKLKTQEDITQDEAIRIFILATVMYTYEMGDSFKSRRWNGFKDKFNALEMSMALYEWYSEVFSRISGYKPMDKYRNYIASIPSSLLCPPTKSEGNTVVSSGRYKVPAEKSYSLEGSFDTTDRLYFNQFRFNNKMVKWLKENVPMSFDIIYHGMNVEFARYGILGSLPIYERKIEAGKTDTLKRANIPFLYTRTDASQEFCLALCPIEYKNILDAIADNAPIPEMPPEKARIPKDIAYINSLTAQLPHQDITLEEADNLYLLFKMYQALRIAILDRYTKEEMEEVVSPGLNALSSWYKTVRKELKRGRQGNFIYTLPNDLDMNLHQLKKPIKECLDMLPKEPIEVKTRLKDKFPVKDIPFDVKCAEETGLSDEYIRYHSSRYGFFKRNDIDLSEWKSILQCKENEDILDDYAGRILLLGKLRFAEHFLGIKQIVIKDTVAVKEKDYPKMLEVLKLSDSKIMKITEDLAQRELEEIRAEKAKLAKTPENYEKLSILERREDILKRMPAIEHVMKAVEMVYEAQKAQEEYFNKNDWMEIDR